MIFYFILFALFSFYLIYFINLEPYWIRKIDYYPSNFKEYIIGNTITNILTKKISKIHLQSNYPIMKMHNGIMRFFMRDVIILKDKEICKTILRDKNSKKPYLSYKIFNKLTNYIGKSDFLSTSSHKSILYKKTRTESYKILMKRTYKLYNEKYINCINEFVDMFHHTTNVPYVTHRLASRILTKIALGVENKSIDQDIFTSTSAIIEDVINRPHHNFFTFLDYLPTNTNKLLHKNQNKLIHALEEIINLKKSENNKYLEDQDDDIIQYLLNVKELKKNDILGIISVLFFAGFDTTANTIAAILFNLSKYPNYQSEIRNEFPKKPNIHNILNQKKLLNFINETLRIYPTVPIISRHISKSNKFLQKRKREYDNTGFIININGLHNDKKYWNNPHQFLPERWNETNIDSKIKNFDCPFIPFSEGKRGCFGRQFAYIEMMTFISFLLQKFEISKCNDDDIEIIEGGTMIVKDFHLRFKNINDHTIFKKSIETIKKENNFIIINDKKINLDKYLMEENHPGGNYILKIFSGLDATKEYNFVKHSKIADQKLKQFQI